MNLVWKKLILINFLFFDFEWLNVSYFYGLFNGFFYNW